MPTKPDGGGGPGSNVVPLRTTKRPGIFEICLARDQTFGRGLVNIEAGDDRVAGAVLQPRDQSVEGTRLYGALHLEHVAHRLREVDVEADQDAAAIAEGEGREVVGGQEPDRADLLGGGALDAGARVPEIGDDDGFARRRGGLIGARRLPGRRLRERLQRRGEENAKRGDGKKRKARHLIRRVSKRRIVARSPLNGKRRLDQEETCSTAWPGG